MNELNRKAMVLGNKLAPRMGGDRKAAFAEAWIIVKAGGLTLPVRGVSFGNRPVALSRLAKYDSRAIKAVAVPEPANTYDPHAVAVMVGINGGRGLYKIGYVPAAMTAAVSVLARQLPHLGVVEGATRGARISLGI